MKNRRRSNLILSLTLGLLGVLAVLAVMPVYANNYEVTNAAASGDGSLWEAIQDANANHGHDTITFDGVTGEIVLTSTLAITDDVTIDGPGAAQLAVSGNNACRVFSITNSVAVTISGLTVQKGFVNGENGGGIWSAGDLRLSAVRIVSNTAVAVSGYGGNGGGLRVEKRSAAESSATLSGTLVSNNMAISGTNGGGISILDGNVTLTDTDVFSNAIIASADGLVGGGGVSVGGTSSGGRLRVSGGRIERNLAVADSLGVEMEAPGVTPGSIKGGLATEAVGETDDNDGVAVGGGVYVFKAPSGSVAGSATLSGTQVISNEALGSLVASGGGVYVYAGNATLTNTHVISNSAFAFIGSIGGGLGVGLDDPTLGSSGTLNMSGGRIENNYAAGFFGSMGGGVGVMVGSAKLSGTHVIGNAAWTEFGYGFGGGVFVYSDTVMLTKTQVISNMAYYGGGVYVESGTAKLNMSGGSIGSNSAITDGGGLCISTMAPIEVAWGNDLTVESGTAQLVMNSGSIERNGALGGGVDIEDGSVTLSGTQVVDNWAGEYGGGVYVYSDTAKLSMSGGSIERNEALDGGGVDIEYGSVTLSGTQVVDNWAEGYGGGVYVYSDTAKLNVSGGSIDSNSAITHGGGVYVYYGTATLTGTQVVYNWAGEDGGGLYLFGIPGGAQMSYVTTRNSRGPLDGSNGTVTVNNSCIVCNSDTAVENGGSGTLDASDNWWGVDDGPSEEGPGSGDSVSTGVDYRDFKTSAPSGCPSYPCDGTGIAVGGVTEPLALPVWWLVTPLIALTVLCLIGAVNLKEVVGRSG